MTGKKRRNSIRKLRIDIEKRRHTLAGMMVGILKESTYRPVRLKSLEQLVELATSVKMPAAVSADFMGLPLEWALTPSSIRV